MAATKEYSVQEKLVGMVRLQKIDSKLDEFAVLKGELPMEVSDLEDEIQGYHSRRIRIEEEVNGILQYIEGRKQHIVDSEALGAKYEKQSNDVKNSREFEAISKEIEMQQLEVKLAEKHIRDANEEMAEKAKSLEAVKKLIASKEGVLNHKKAELEKIIVETEKEEKHFNDLSVDARKSVDERLLYSYDRIRSSYRNGLAVVTVDRDACGGCFNAIPPQRQSEIKLHKKVIVCENCGRILIDEDLAASVEIK